MRIYNFTHSSDLDGLSSAALLVHYYGVPLKNVFFTNYNGKIYDDTIKFISAIRGEDNILIFSDFGMPDANVAKMRLALAKFKKKNNHVLWFDHHQWSMDAIKELSKFCDIMVVGENRDMCGAELVYKFLCNKNPFGEKVVRITHLADFALESKSAKDNAAVYKMDFAIRGFRNEAIDNPGLRKLVKCVADDKMDGSFINGLYKKYKKKAAPHMKKLMETATLVKVGDLRVIVGFAKNVSHQEAAMAMLEKFKADVAIYISTETGHSSIRSSRDKRMWGVDNSPIAIALGGGGHPLASGFSLAKSGYKLDDRADQEKIVTRINGILEKSYWKRVRFYQQTTGKFLTQ